MPRPSLLTIDLDALRHNARLVRSLAGKARVMAAVKADAYGHGLVHCARALAPGVDALAVAFTEEALELRSAGLTLPILVLEGPFDADDVAHALSHRLALTIHTIEQITLLDSVEGSVGIPIWVKVDTGMHRLGFAPGDVRSTLSALTLRGHRDVVLVSHLACAEQPDAPLCQRQIGIWDALSAQHSGEHSLLNSAGVLGHLGQATDWVRPGYVLYGGRPSPAFDTLPAKAVMTMTSRVMAVRDVAAGDSVGYGGRWIAPQQSRIATVPVGYGDGYPRGASDGTPVMIEGKPYPLAGKVSMDMITVDVTANPDIDIGARVELWGQGLSVDTVAAHADTIGYELMTRLTSRLPRQYLGARVDEHASPD